jgi:hypothetical protein
MLHSKIVAPALLPAGAAALTNPVARFYGGSAHGGGCEHKRASGHADSIAGIFRATTLGFAFAAAT